MKFIDLVNANADELAELLSRARQDHRRQLGDIQRGIEVIGVRRRYPAFDEGRVHRGRRAGHRRLFHPPAARGGLRYHPVQLPGHDPLWKAGPALACGNAFILKPRSAIPRCRCGWPNCSSRPACRRGLQVVQGDKEAVDAILTHPDIKAVGFVGSSDIAQYIYSTAAA